MRFLILLATGAIFFTTPAFAQKGEMTVIEAVQALFAAYPAEVVPHDPDVVIAPPPTWSEATVANVVQFGVNFGGQYYAGTRGCGTQCQSFEILNPGGAREDGMLTAAAGLLFTPESLLVIVNDPEELGYWPEDQPIPPYLYPSCHVYDGTRFNEVECTGLPQH